MIGDRIKLLRTARSLSQVELAGKLNVSKQSVSNWENNNILPSVEVVTQLARFFSCSTDYLLGIDDTHNFLEVSGLTSEELAHIQFIINAIKKNKQP